MLAQHAQQLDAEAVRIAHFLLRRMQDADQARHAFQRRLDRDRLARRQHLLHHAVPLLDGGDRLRPAQRAGVVVQVHLAGRRMAELDPMPLQQRIHRRLRFHRQLEHRQGVLAKARCRRVAQERQPPLQRIRIEQPVHAEHRVEAEQKLRQVFPQRRAAQRVGIDIAQLGAVGERGAECGTARAIDQAYRQAAARRRIGGGHADHARTQHGDVRRALVGHERRRLRIGRRHGRPRRLGWRLRGHRDGERMRSSHRGPVHHACMPYTATFCTIALANVIGTGRQGARRGQRMWALSGMRLA